MILNNIIYVAIGGACGASLRYIIQYYLNNFLSNNIYSTSIINIIGSILGAVLFIIFTKYMVENKYKIFIMTGILGGFTTHYKMIEDIHTLIKNNEIITLSIYLILSLILPIIIFSIINLIYLK